MSLWDYIMSLLLSLRPSENPDPKIQLAWRWTVAGLLFGMILVSGASLAWARGWIPGLPGVATKADVSDATNSLNNKITTFSARVGRIESTVDSINLRLIKTDIQKALQDACTAEALGNAAALKSLNDDLYGTNSSEGLLEQYQNLAHRDFPVPPCSAMLIQTKPGKPGN